RSRRLSTRGSPRAVPAIARPPPSKSWRSSAVAFERGLRELDHVLAERPRRLPDPELADPEGLLLDQPGVEAVFVLAQLRREQPRRPQPPVTDRGSARCLSRAVAHRGLQHATIRACDT